VEASANVGATADKRPLAVLNPVEVTKIVARTVAANVAARRVVRRAMGRVVRTVVRRFAPANAAAMRVAVRAAVRRRTAAATRGQATLAGVARLVPAWSWMAVAATVERVVASREQPARMVAAAEGTAAKGVAVPTDATKSKASREMRAVVLQDIQNAAGSEASSEPSSSETAVPASPVTL